jgi:hypothetical protein
LTTCLPAQVAAHCRGHEVRLFAFVTAILGSDFSTGIPRCGVTTLFKHMAVIWGPLQKAYDPVTMEFNVRLVADTVIGPLLAIVHKRHAAGSNGKDLKKLLATIRMSSLLSESARDALPTVVDIACLVRNSNWTLQYWWDATTVPPSNIAKYGFSVQAKNGETERDMNASLD